MDSFTVNQFDKRETYETHHKVLGCYDYMHFMLSGVSEFSQVHEGRGGPLPLDWPSGFSLLERRMSLARSCTIITLN